MAGTYHARLLQDQSGVWLADVEEIPGVHTFGRTLGKAREYLVDALALWLNEPVARVRDRVSFDAPELPSSVQDLVARSVVAREIAATTAEHAREETERSALALVDEARLSQRDAAEVLGLSHQRVQQVVREARATPPPPPVAVRDAVVAGIRRLLPGGEDQDVGALVAALALIVTLVAADASRSS